MEQNDMIASRALSLCRKYRTNDPFEIAEALNIRINRTDKLKSIKGMYTVIKRNRIIILNDNNPERLNRIVCAHEIGHDQLHRDFARDSIIHEFTLYDMSTRLEYEANIFAANLLLDDDTVIEMIERGYDIFGISSALGSDTNLVALKVDSLIHKGYGFRKQEHDTGFLR